MPSEAPIAPLENVLVEVWCADLDRPTGSIARFLSEAERGRAGRLSSERSRERWIRGRALLRELLGRYLGRDPATIELSSGHNGKLQLADGGPLRFNLSHSAGTALFAFAVDNQVGVDLEHLGRR